MDITISTKDNPVCVKIVNGAWSEGLHTFKTDAFCDHCGRWKGFDIPKVKRDMAMPDKPPMSQETKDHLKQINDDRRALRNSGRARKLKVPVSNAQARRRAQQTQSGSGFPGATKQSRAALDKILGKV